MEGNPTTRPLGVVQEYYDERLTRDGISNPMEGIPDPPVFICDADLIDPNQTYAKTRSQAGRDYKKGEAV